MKMTVKLKNLKVYQSGIFLKEDDKFDFSSVFRVKKQKQ
jgi:hypothetical protein